MTPRDEPGRDSLSKTEIRKDALQDTVEATAAAVGAVSTIVTTAVRDIARTMGGLATEVFEIREAVRRARAEHTPEDTDSASEADCLGCSGTIPGPCLTN